ncbi:MAG: L,D-transpeptidase family protein [Candidatus Omnitrophica bacterium]|nr:L,D-transpeptidase family protein [Candidatus Omnitrophota bacterium]
MLRRLFFLGLIILVVSLGGLGILSLKRYVNQSKEKKEEIALSLDELYNQAQGLQAKGKLLEAKQIYQRLINEYPNSNQIINWQKRLEEINIKLLFSPIITDKSIAYEIKAGDNLSKIAAEFKTTAELIMKSNNLSSDKIIPGRRLKVWTRPFSIVIDKSQNILILKSDEEIIKTYIVSTGVNNSTPTGTFKIINKLINPTWFKTGAVVPPDSPENILGSRWLGFNIRGYGIHGTSDPQSLGKQATQGCIRMSNADVEELYTIVSIGTEVTIID